MIAGLLVLLSFQLAGELISLWLGWPIPGAVVGMLLLLLSLRLWPSIWPERLLAGTERVSHGLISNLNLLFLPAGVGLFFMPAHINAQWPALLAAMVLGTLASLCLCSWLLRWLAGAAAQSDAMDRP